MLTVLEKLLHAHPNVVVGSQPFPVLYFYAKTRFLDSLNLRRRYALGHLFLEDDYEPDQFQAFLEEHDFSSHDLVALFDQMETYADGV